MSTLSTELRNKLERTIVQAREAAEAGAKVALEALAAHHHEPYGHMSHEERKLRNHLRARARQLGDKQNRKGELEITHLVWECAYEHWHRMLFARFLAENDLLIESEMGVAISLEECEELAKEEGKDLWTLASEFAQRMLPQIFRPDDPILNVALAREHRIKLEKLLDDLEPSVFTASDSLGWVYQFWQSKRKKEVNESGNKIGADELPAVTQLFTEPYMVSFLLDNSLGAWWAARRLTEADLQNAKNEEELRSKASLPGVPLEYLRFVKVAEASSLCKKEIGYFHRDEPVSNLSGDLPHWRQEGVTYFVTFRTADSLPQEKLKQWQLEKERWLHDHPEPCDGKSKREFYEKFPERLQHWLDQGYGECVLEEQDCKKIVEGALRHFDGQRYALDEFVIMPNHVHVLVTPKAGHELSKILHSWKSFTATEINKRIGKSDAFWQKESFDHIVRSPAQVERIRQYIKEHPAYSGRGFQPQKSQRNQRQDAASTIWTPAAGIFDAWPDHLSELKTLDPCCGSGHFLVAAFLMLVPMRMELESFSARDACDAVLRENIHGLEIDKRCVELAAFSLALAAWGYPDTGGYRPLPELNVACTGIAISAKKEEWIALAGDNINLRMALEELYKQFKDAPVLGSLINPEIGLAKGSLFELKWEEVGPLLTTALAGEKDDEKAEMGIAAQGIAKAASLLAMKYEWVVTNVPYLSYKKMGMQLKEYIQEHFPNAKGDLANVFLERCIEFSSDSGVIQTVMTQNWLFLSSYKRQREQLLREMLWNLLVKLGGGAEAFNNGPGNITNICMVTKTKSHPNDFDVLQIIDVSEANTPGKKSAELRTADLIEEIQKRQLENPDARIASGIDVENLLEKKAICPRGVVSGDGERWVRRIWEHRLINKDWRYLQGTISGTALYSGRDKVIDWSSDGEGMLRPGRDNLALGKLGVNVSLIGVLPVTLYSGNLYDQTTASIVPNNINDLAALYCYCSSKEFNKDIREIDQKLNVTPATLIKVPFDLDHWTKVAKEKYPNGLPKPYSDDPTQWIFHGHPARSENPLQVALARLLDYRWPAELDRSMELSEEACSCVKKSEILLSYSDEDGIVCIPSVRGEESATNRLQELLAVAFNSNWSPAKEQELILATGANASNFDEWLRDHFFEQHCKLFYHRPFIWHIWDGRRRDGFHVLVNYHKLAEGNGKGRQLLEKLTYAYLGDWIIRQKEGGKRGEGGAEDRLAAALELQKRLIAIIESEPPFDIFVRWKPIENQPIGWEPDINDGVRLNIRPFMAPDMPDGSRKGADITGGRKGAGILRWKPNIKWNKDRGKDVASAPWFALFKGDRVNDHHLSLEEKRNARAEANRR